MSNNGLGVSSLSPSVFLHLLACSPIAAARA